MPIPSLPASASAMALSHVGRGSANAHSPSPPANPAQPAVTPANAETAAGSPAHRARAYILEHDPARKNFGAIVAMIARGELSLDAPADAASETATDPAPTETVDATEPPAASLPEDAPPAAEASEPVAENPAPAGDQPPAAEEAAVLPEPAPGVTADGIVEELVEALESNSQV